LQWRAAWAAEQRRIDEAFALAGAERQREREAAATEAKRVADARAAEDAARQQRESERLAQEAADRKREADERQAAIDAERIKTEAAEAEIKRLREAEEQRIAREKPLAERYGVACAALRSIAKIPHGREPLSVACAKSVLAEIGETP